MINIITKKTTIIALLLLIMTGCAVGPDYVKPAVAIPSHFKEAPKNSKIAQPQDDYDRGQWWLMFNDPQLSGLEQQLNIANQNIAVAVARYRQAVALVNEARASYFPTLTAILDITRQHQGSNGFLNPGSNAVSSSSGGTFNSHFLQFNASWEPDIWGSVRRNVEANVAGAQASAAALALARLSAQGSLAQFYFQLRALDADQQLLNRTVTAYQRVLQLTQNRYRAGVAGRADVVQAQTQVEAAQALALNNGINRAQFEHAIAILIGQPPADFALTAKPLAAKPPQIPLQLPSTLLERRPDVAQVERLMARTLPKKK